jgi:ATP-dependent protease ClpP protease subunit
MSLRKLPELRRPAAPAKIGHHLSEAALRAWNPDVRAKLGDNTITIFEEIGENFWGEGVSPNRIAAALRSIGEKPVTVQINSPGGNFFDGLAIYNLLRLHPAKVTVQIVGIAASAASVVTMAGDDIQIAPAGMLMIHNTQWVTYGDRHAMLAAHDAMEIFDEAVIDLYVERTGMKASAVRQMCDAETFISANQAVELGFADKKIDIDLMKDQAAEKPAALYRVEQALASGTPMPRAERRKLIKEILEGMPGAAEGVGTPGAAVETGADDGTVELTVALGRLKALAL